MRIFLIVYAVVSAIRPAMAAERQIQVPLTSAAVMIDGVLSDGEWRNAAVVEVPHTARVYFQRSTEFVFIAVEYTHSRSGIVDLYVSPAGGEIYDLHASAKLGERRLNDNTFADWTWWNNRDWTANVSRVDSFEKRTFLPAPIREYQIRTSRFPADTWRVRLELTAMTAASETQSVTVFPSGTSDKSSSGWLLLMLK